MHEDFERYKAELDRVRLTEESRRALAESLRRRRVVERPEIKSRRPRLGARRIAAVAAAVCLLSVLSIAAVAQVRAEPTLGNAFTGDHAGYDQSSGVVGRTAECGGWTATITDCVGDDFQAFLGVEIEAPEGTVLDAEYYEVYMDNEYDRQGVSGTLKGFFYSLPDDDPTDNKIRLIYNWYTTEGESNHVRMHSKLADLTENRGYLWEECTWDRLMVKAGEWDFGWIDIDYADNAIRLYPMVELPCEDDLVLEEAVISPVGLYFRTNISCPCPIAFGDWFDENILSTVRLLDTDGNEIPLNTKYFYGPGGTYFSFTDHVNAMNTANAEGLAGLELVDLDRIAELSIAGISIPVQ